MGRVKDPLYRGLLFGDAFFCKVVFGAFQHFWEEDSQASVRFGL